MGANVHKLSGYGRESVTATCSACGDVEIIWKSRGKDRPRTPVCREAYNIDRQKQRLKGSSTAYAESTLEQIAEDERQVAAGEMPKYPAGSAWNRYLARKESQATKKPRHFLTERNYQKQYAVCSVCGPDATFEIIWWPEGWMVPRRIQCRGAQD